MAKVRIPKDEQARAEAVSPAVLQNLSSMDGLVDRAVQWQMGAEARCAYLANASEHLGSAIRFCVFTGLSLVSLGSMWFTFPGPFALLGFVAGFCSGLGSLTQLGDSLKYVRDRRAAKRHREQRLADWRKPSAQAVCVRSFVDAVVEAEKKKVLGHAAPWRKLQQSVEAMRYKAVQTQQFFRGRVSAAMDAAGYTDTSPRAGMAETEARVMAGDFGPLAAAHWAAAKRATAIIARTDASLEQLRQHETNLRDVFASFEGRANALAGPLEDMRYMQELEELDRESSALQGEVTQAIVSSVADLAGRMALTRDTIRDMYEKAAIDTVVLAHDTGDVARDLVPITAAIEQIVAQPLAVERAQA